MAKFVKVETNDDDCLFAAFGKLGRNQDAEKSVLVKEGESIEGVVTNIKKSKKYGSIYTLKVKKEDKPVVVTGKTDLNKKMAAGNVGVNDLVRITYKGSSKTENGFDYKNFDVAVAQE